jgi:hypothetical protein
MGAGTSAVEEKRQRAVAAARPSAEQEALVKEATNPRPSKEQQTTGALGSVSAWSEESLASPAPTMTHEVGWQGHPTLRGC